MINFVRRAWHVLEPHTEFVEGWVTRAICRHLEAITRGEFIDLGLENRVRMNTPPGCTKSLLVSVMWNAWEWGPMNMAHLRHVSTSFSERNVKRDTRKTRDLILSDWYQTHWPHVKLTRIAETSFENTLRGSREGVPFPSLTGMRGDRLTMDDPHSTEGSESEVERATVTRVFRDSATTRVNDPRRSAIALIMQRVHPDDCCSIIDRLGLPFINLILPMEFEADNRCVTPIFKDPRTFEGELLFPERFPRAIVDRDKRAMTAYAVAGQFQQRPRPREGGMFKRAWLPITKLATNPYTGRPLIPPMMRWCRHWDLAATEDTYSPDQAWTAGVLLGGPDGEGCYWVADVQRVREESPGVRKLMLATAASDAEWVGSRYEIQVPQDPGATGKMVARDLIKALAGYDAHKWIESGSKEQRAEPFAAQAENGAVKLIAGPWNEAYIEEMCDFPGAKVKDQVDATSGAFARLLRPPRYHANTGGGKVLPIYAR